MRAQGVKAFATESGDLVSISRIHIVEGQSRLTERCPLTSIQVLWLVTHAHRDFKDGGLFFLIKEAICCQIEATALTEVKWNQAELNKNTCSLNLWGPRVVQSHCKSCTYVCMHVCARTHTWHKREEEIGRQGEEERQRDWWCTGEPLSVWDQDQYNP